MGEAKPEETKAESKPEEKKEEKVDEKKEEKAEEKKEENAEEKKEEEKAPPPPVVLFVDMHCVGCAKKVERCLMRCKGVEGVQIDIHKNEITIKGIVEPQALCMRIQKKTNRRAKVLSPPPPAEGDVTQPQIVSSQVNGVTTVVLQINMHCEACAEQLKRKILKMRGVQSAETELNNNKVTVTGTMEANRLVDYIYRRTGKQAKIVPPPPELEKPKEEAPNEDAKPPEEAQKAEEKKDEEKPEKKDEATEKPPEEKKEATKDNGDNAAEGDKKEKETPAEKVEEPKKEGEEIFYYFNNDDAAKKIMYWPPVYVIQHVPPPQLFSDENPNACCIS